MQGRILGMAWLAVPAGTGGSSPCATSCALSGSDSWVRNSHCGSLYYRAELGLFCLSSIYLALEACPEFSNFVCVCVCVIY